MVRWTGEIVLSQTSHGICACAIVVKVEVMFNSKFVDKGVQHGVKISMINCINVARKIFSNQNLNKVVFQYKSLTDFNPVDLAERIAG